MIVLFQMTVVLLLFLFPNGQSLGIATRRDTFNSFIAVSQSNRFENDSTCSNNGNTAFQILFSLRSKCVVIMLLPTTIVGLLVTGMGLALLGSVKMPLARKLQIDEIRVGGLISLFGFTMIPVILAAGFLADTIGRQAVLISGGVLMAVSLVVLARSRTYPAALFAVLMLSAGWSAQTNVTNVLIPAAFGNTKMYALNMGNFFFGLGAFLTPLAITVLLRKAGFTWALYALAVLVLMSALLPVSVDFSELSQEQTETGFRMLLGDPIMWLCALALFFYGPMEAAMAAWTTTYLSEMGTSETTASGLLSGFWLAFMSSRLITAMIITWDLLDLPEEIEPQMILGLGLLSLGVLLCVVFSKTKTMAIAMVIAAGFVFGPVFPSIMSVLLGHFDKAVHGRAVGLLFAIGGIGWTTIPMLIGAYAKRTSVQQSFLVAAAAALGLCTVAITLIVFSAS
jgi:fucose permease